MLSTTKVARRSSCVRNVILLRHVEAGGELAKASITVKNAKLGHENAQIELNKVKRKSARVQVGAFFIAYI